MDVNLNLKVNSGNHPRKNCPTSFPLKKDFEAFEGRTFTCASLLNAEKVPVPVQLIEKKDTYEIVFMIASMDAHKEEIYTLSLSEDNKETEKTVNLTETEKGIDISVGGTYLTSYVCSEEFAKPYIGPFISPYGTHYTRLDFETTEHIHQRSVWFAIGDIEGHDFWNEPAGLYGKQVHQSYDSLVSGPVAGKIVTKNDWVTQKGTKLMTDTRSVTVYATEKNGRIVDLELTLQAAGRRVEIGATKEAGPLGVRVNESMKVDNGGTMINSYGSVSEKECWGKKAEWCDYYGPVEGKTLGISVFDNPSNDSFPTFWHIRNYGLFAPNNFYFAGGKILKPDEKITFKYRLYFHTGTTVDASIGERYQDYINPPTVTL